MASRTPRLICEYLNIHKSYLFPLCVSDCVNYKKLNLKHKNRRAPISPKTNDEAIVFGKMDVSQKKIRDIEFHTKRLAHFLRPERHANVYRVSCR